jgi:hypothetical protein
MTDRPLSPFHPCGGQGLRPERAKEKPNAYNDCHSLDGRLGSGVVNVVYPGGIYPSPFAHRARGAFGKSFSRTAQAKIPGTLAQCGGAIREMAVIIFLAFVCAGVIALDQVTRGRRVKWAFSSVSY